MASPVALLIVHKRRLWCGYLRTGDRVTPVQLEGFGVTSVAASPDTEPLFRLRSHCPVEEDMDLLMERVKPVQHRLNAHIFSRHLRDAVGVHQEAESIFRATAYESVLKGERYLARYLQPRIGQRVLNIADEIVDTKKAEQMGIDVTTPVMRRNVRPVKKIDVAQSLLRKLRWLKSAQNNIPDMSKALTKLVVVGVLCRD